MPEKTLRISGVGCGLLDYIYADVNFEDAGLQTYFSASAGDGGIRPGKLVFSEDLEKYSGEDLEKIYSRILPGVNPDVINVGGPCIVALIHASQLLHELPLKFSYFGAMGSDATGRELRKLIARTPLKLENYVMIEGATPRTVVLSDPRHRKGEGERAFINTIGVAASYEPERLTQQFFDADILFFGGTALVPPIHDHLFELLEKGKSQGLVNIVTTVFDFRNENRAPQQRWPLGNSEEAFKYMDLLIMDQEEALRISGEHNEEVAAAFFIKQGTASFIITRGADDILLFSDGTFFAPHALARMPVLPIGEFKHEGMVCDTTGCGDNFAGGVLSSLLSQMVMGKQGDFDLVEACSWGVVSGTYTGLIAGGVEFEKKAGEKLDKIRRLYQDYRARK